MRLVSYAAGDGWRLGALLNGAVTDLSAASGGRLPATMLEFLDAGQPALDEARRVLTGPLAPMPLGAVRLGPVVPNPRKIICVGLNYRDHALEVGKAPPTLPVYFTRFTSTLVGPDDPVVKPHISDRWDYEAELAVIMGRRCRAVNPAWALDCVAGYTVANDLSARDFQQRTPQWTPGKNFDGSCPLGPALVTADEVPDPHNLAVRLTVNGEILQDSSTSHLIFGLPEIIADISQWLTLEPGDVILTGTPAGVGMARKPPRYLQVGDVVEVEIAGLGRIRNEMVAEG